MSSPSPDQKISFTLNGKPCELQVHPETSLMTALRDGCDVISPKNGCAPQGQCGCCTVMVDGKAVVSCVVDATKTQGKNVLTLEGLSAQERDILRESFVWTAGLQ